MLIQSRLDSMWWMIFALKTPSELIPQEVLSTENVGFSFLG